MIELVVRFQWVKCQLDALGRCLNLSSLRKALRSLPKDLDNTYDRILQSIEDNEHGRLFATIVQWLVNSIRPMSLAEISEALTVDPNDDQQFDVERRLEDPQDLLRICSSFVTTKPIPGNHWTSPGRGEMLVFAHFSVFEYLKSSKSYDGPGKRYAIQGIHSNTFIAESCIIYLLHYDVPQKRTDDDYLDSPHEENPLAKYAASRWLDHAERAEEGRRIIALSKAFFREVHRHPTVRWAIRDSIISGWYFDSQGSYLPLLHASMLDVPKITRAFILEGADVNAPNKNGMTPWTEILNNKHERIELIQLFLDHGAGANARDEDGLTALMIAASSGELQTVRMLLDYGADPHAHDRDTEDTAIILATREGHPRVVEYLLDRGVSISSDLFVEALQAAFLDHHQAHEILRILLARGVDIDAELQQPRASEGVDGLSIFTTALLRALDFDVEKVGKDVAEVLLEYGADVNASSTVEGSRGVALEHALKYSNWDFMIDFLLEHGADPSLVKPEHLNELDLERYEEILLKIQGQNQSLQMQEETKVAKADL